MSVVIWCFLLLYQNMLICNAGYAAKVDVLLDEKHQRITNGNIAAPCQFPWQVALIIDNTYFCGGSFISSNGFLLLHIARKCKRLHKLIVVTEHREKHQTERQLKIEENYSSNRK